MKKLFLALLMFAGLFAIVTLEQWLMLPKEVQAQTNTFCAANLACTVTGIWTFTGLVQPKSIENVKYVDPSNSQGWAGTDLAGWIASAFASMTQQSGTVWVSSGSYATPAASIVVGASPCVNAPSNAWSQTLIFDSVQVTINNPIKVLCGGYLSANGSNPFGSWVTAGASLGANPMIDVGDAVNVTNAGVAYMRLNCNSQASCTGIRARGLQDLSYLRLNQVQNYLVNCINVDGTVNLVGNMKIEQNMCGAATGAGDSLVLNEVSAALVERNSNVSGSGVAITGASISIKGNVNNQECFHLIYNHSEKHTDGVLVDGPACVIIESEDLSNGTTNAIHIKGTASGSVTVNMVHSNANSGSNPLVLNDVTTTSILSTQPNGVLTDYKWMNSQYEYWVDTVGMHWSPNSSAQSIFSKARIEGLWHLSDQGAACTNGELALSAGWQSTGSATVTAVAGNGPQVCSWTITTGTTTAANPTITDTLISALPNATTVCWMNIYGGTHVAVAGESLRQTTLSATAPVFTANFTPTNTGATYFVTRGCGP